jgi:pilus assembly protein Flp/PilA
MDLATIWERIVTVGRTKVRSERGASLVEYALLVALIAIVCIAAVTLLGTSASTTFSSVAGQV